MRLPAAGELIPDGEEVIPTRVATDINTKTMTAAQRAAYRKALKAQQESDANDAKNALAIAQATIDVVNKGINDISASQTSADEALKQAEYYMQLAAEQEQTATIAGNLAKSEQDKAAAEAAAKAAAEKAALEAALKNAQDANTKSNLQSQLNALNAATAASGNINTAGNVYMPNTPAAGGMSAADILAKQYAEAQAQKEKELQMQRQSIMDVLTDRMTRYNLTGLIPTIKRLAQEGATEATITLALQETEDYKRRFRANQERIKKGLQVLTPAEYLNLEDGYRQILRSYGLEQFNTDDYVSQFIANDVSAAELSNRVVTAVQRVRNADPAVSKTLRDYYGIGDTDLVAYVLDPNQAMPKIERQVAAAEIGTAARRQGIEAGVGVAEQLAAQGITQAEAQRGYSTIASILPGAEKLSQIYGGTLENYDLAQAEQEVFNQLASAQRRRQRLTEREIASFQGASGTGRTSLNQIQRGQF